MSRIRRNRVGAGTNYDAGNKRIYEKRFDGGTQEWVYFFGVTGQRLARYTFTVAGSAITFTQETASVWFGGKLVQKVNSLGSTYAYEDRLGSVGRYLPYGEDKPGATGNPANDNEKFGTYTRDANTGIDYADQRWHAQGTGRLLTADPYQASAGPGDPGSWNRYGYVQGDPLQNNDPTGLVACGELSVANGISLGSEVLANTDWGHFIQLVWHEAGFRNQYGNDVNSWTLAFFGIAQAVWNRYTLVTTGTFVVGKDGITYGGLGNPASQLGYGNSKSTLNDILKRAASGTNVLNDDGSLKDNKDTLVKILNQEQGYTDRPGPGRILVQGVSGPMWVTQDCYSVITAYQATNDARLGSFNQLTEMFVTSWNSSAPIFNPNFKAGREYYLGSLGPTNLYGFYNWGTVDIGIPFPRPPIKGKPEDQ